MHDKNKSYLAIIGQLSRTHVTEMYFVFFSISFYSFGSDSGPIGRVYDWHKIHILKAIRKKIVEVYVFHHIVADSSEMYVCEHCNTYNVHAILHAVQPLNISELSNNRRWKISAKKITKTKNNKCKQ